MQEDAERDLDLLAAWRHGRRCDSGSLPLSHSDSGLDEEKELFCRDWRLSPKSAESAFCVVSTSASGKDQRLLERDAQLLVHATDAYAKRYKADFKAGHNSRLKPDTTDERF